MLGSKLRQWATTRTCYDTGPSRSTICGVTYASCASRWSIHAHTRISLRRLEIRDRRFDIPILVVGTKCDLVNDVDAVSRLRVKGEAPLTREDGLRLAETINAVGYVECSSLSGLGLDQVFREACKAGLDAKEPLHDNE